MLAAQMRDLAVGDRVTLLQRQVGRPPRHGVVAEVVTEDGHERCRVRWDDGEESFVYPGASLVVESRLARKAKEAAT